MSALNPSLSAPWLSDEETPKTASFARTLRAFAEQKRAETSRPRPSPATSITQIKQKRPLRPLGPLQRGPEKVAGRKMPELGTEQPSAAQAVAAKKASRAAKAPVVCTPSRQQSAPLLARAWGWLQKQNAFSGKKQLRVCETVSLGEKRFVAVVQIDGQKFLIGGGSAGVSLLSELDTEPESEMDAAPENENEGEPEGDGEDLSRILESIACAGGRSR